MRQKSKQHKKIPKSRVSSSCCIYYPVDVNVVQAQAKPPTVESDPLEDIPLIDENNVETFSEQVACAFSDSCVSG